MNATVHEAFRLIVAAGVGAFVGSAYQPFNVSNSNAAPHEPSAVGRYITARDGGLLVDTQTGTLYRLGGAKWEKMTTLEDSQ